MTIELIMAVALWCGSPVDTSSKIFADWSTYDVNKCRAELVKCINKQRKAMLGKYPTCFKEI